MNTLTLEHRRDRLRFLIPYTAIPYTPYFVSEQLSVNLNPHKHLSGKLFDYGLEFQGQQNR